MMRWTWVAVPVVLVACFNATYDFKDGDIFCDAKRCPPGYTCGPDLRCYRALTAADAAPADVPIKPDATGPDCTNGALRCSSNLPQKCEGGLWRDQTACPVDKPMCLAGLCQPGCTPGTHDCNGRMLLECDAQGLWQPATLCDNACYQGGCTGTCKPGDTRCSGITVEECGVRGSWLMGGTCPFACVAGECKGECKPTQQRCSPTEPLVPQTCDANGSWSSGAPCAFSCQAGACTGACSPVAGGECAPCATKCELGVPYGCSAAGKWVAGPPCAFVCAGDICGGECKPGTARCNSSIRETCSETGMWMGVETCPFGCTGETCDACVAESKERTCDGRCGQVENNCKTLVDCGNDCPPLTSCGGGGVDNSCGCTPDLSTTTCRDKCGTVVNNCGQGVACSADNGGITCNPPRICGVGGAPPNSCCVRDSQSATCSGKCGDLLDNCGVSVSCGDTCASQGPLYTCGGAMPNRCGCTPGTKRCEGVTPQTCSPEGTWVSGTACEFVCEGGTCQGSCTPGTMSCNGNTPRSCVGGQWVDGQTCVNSTCNDGVCVGVCVAGSHRCSENAAQTCDDHGQWQGSTCSHQTCVNGACQGVCAPGETRCSPDFNPNVLDSCDPTGQWVMSTTCMYLCDNGRCTGECFPGDHRCQPTPTNGTKVQVCNNNYKWEDEKLCSFGCNEGMCCESNASACPGTGGSVCNAKVTKDCGIDVFCDATCNATFTCGGNPDKPNTCGCKPDSARCIPDSAGRYAVCNKTGDGWNLAQCPSLTACCDLCGSVSCIPLGQVCAVVDCTESGP